MPNPARPRRRDRAGYALVLFVMMFFGLMALAALVIDMGFVRLAQRQMQTAVDSAALEGLRWRDAIPNSMNSDPEFLALQPDFNPTAPTPDDMDCARRLMASRVVADGPVTSGSSARPSMFANYVDNSGGTVSYGAGPVVNFGPGIPPTDLAAGQTITWPPPPPYQPTRSVGITPGLELNQSSGNLNAREGDMVAGTYRQNTTDPPDGTADEGTTAADGSGNPYHRRDFQNTSNQAFLVRMRRTNNTSSNTSNTTSSFDQEGGISSSGPTLPVLFGQGSMMARSGNKGQLSVASGVTVRATAIAAAGDGIAFGGSSYSVGRAKTAGPPFQQINQDNPADTVNVPGVAPFALSATALASGTLNVQSDGSIIVNGGTAAIGQTIIPSLLEIGQQIGGPSKSITTVDAAGLSSYYNTLVATPPSGYTGPNLLALSQYVPLIDTNNTIIGFGYVQSWTWNGDATGGTLNITIGPSGSVGYGNVSGAFVPGLTQDTTDFTTLFNEHATFSNPLYAPVLVNHYIGPTP